MLFTAIATLLVHLANAAPCAEWDSPRQVGALALKEASGMTFSRTVKDRLYWIQDSGNGARFFHTTSTGGKFATVSIEGYVPRDPEALSTTECPEGPCLVIGDIGDNRRRRPHITLVFLADRESFPKSVRPLHMLRLKYPDGAHDAEAMAFLPDGDLLVFSKEPDRTRVYTLTREELFVKKENTLRLLVELANPKWVTDAAVHARREVLGLLTYANAVEIPLARLKDLQNDQRVVPLKPLFQQEAITYAPDEDRVLWSTEYTHPRAPIFSMTCKRQLP